MFLSAKITRLFLRNHRNVNLMTRRMFGKSRQELDNEQISYIIQLKFEKFKTKLVSENCSKV